MLFKMLKSSFSEMKSADSATKKQISSLAFMGTVLLFSVGVLASIMAIAWFTNNKEVGANALEVKVNADESLVISSSSTINPTAENPYSLSPQTDEEKKLKLTAAMRDTAEAYNDSAHLKTLKSGANIDTGLASADATYVAAEKNKNYLEYTFYIGTVNKDYKYSSLTATISTGLDLSVATNSYFKSASVDFYYVDNSNNEYYKGTLSLNDIYKNSKASVSILENVGTIAIGTPIQMKIRLYFDGSMTETVDGVTKAVLRSSTISADQLNLTVTFTAPKQQEATSTE